MLDPTRITLLFPRVRLNPLPLFFDRYWEEMARGKDEAGNDNLMKMVESFDWVSRATIFGDGTTIVFPRIGINRG